MKSSILCLAATSLLFAGCSSFAPKAPSSETPVVSTEGASEDVPAEETKGTGLVVTGNKKVQKANLGLSISSLQRAVESDSVSESRTDNGGYMFVVSDMKDGYNYGIIAETDDQDMVTSLWTISICPADDDSDYFEDSLEVPDSVFTLIPGFKSNTLSKLGKMSKKVDGHFEEAGVFGTYVAAYRLEGIDNDRVAVTFVVNAYSEDRAGGDTTFESVNEGGDPGISKDNAYSKILNGN